MELHRRRLGRAQAYAARNGCNPVLATACLTRIRQAIRDAHSRLCTNAQAAKSLIREVGLDRPQWRAIPGSIRQPGLHQRRSG
ncbi:MAG: hypothetical protein U0790_20615 [Isosphaeraceae bacterium]